MGENAHPVINQLISSSIVHPTPPAVVLFALEQMAKHEDEIDRGIKAVMSKLPCSDHRIIGVRNFLSLEYDHLNRIWAKWYVQNQEIPYTKVIHPVVEAFAQETVSQIE